ncbi:MAG: methyltransferase domain-containing protein [Chloroflexota bacterium]
MSKEFNFLWENAQAAAHLNVTEMRHLASRVALLSYIRIANEIARQERGGRILDWGCGYGQMSYLLQQRGFDVVSYDVGCASQDARLPLSREIHAIIGDDSVRLPFPDAHFDAVLSCGVLEHVPDEEGSLAEIHRALKPRGIFFIYNLPQKYSYKEFLIARFKLGYTHERKYTLGAARALLAKHGFQIVHSHRTGILPHTLTGLPARVRSMYDIAARQILIADRLLSRVPVLNQTSEVLEIIARAQ